MAKSTKKRLLEQQHMILTSLKEEIQAIDDYNQRAAVSTGSARKDLLHFMDEEMEHACMALEWLRVNMPGFDEKMRELLFQE